jgi:nucleoid-associated protein YgaU
MGNFEKLVVLTVLFLSAIVLAISLNDGRKKPEPDSPVDLQRSSTVLDDESPLVETNAGVAGSGTGSAGLLLSTEVTPDEVADAEPAAAVSGSILRDTSDLRKAGLDDYMVYTAAEGDTWAGLAERFYGSGRHVTLLRHANEDMVSPLAGESILVPVRDLSAEAGRRAPLTVREDTGDDDTLGSRAPVSGADTGSGDEVAGLGSSAPARARDARATEASGAPSADLSTVTVYEVRAGDSLTGIAQRLYGAASRWNVLYEANRAQMQSPDWLQVGMKLTVPRGSALAALASAEPSTPEPRATPAEQPTVRKGKVR